MKVLCNSSVLKNQDLRLIEIYRFNLSLQFVPILNLFLTVGFPFGSSQTTRDRATAIDQQHKLHGNPEAARDYYLCA